VIICLSSAINAQQKTLNLILSEQPQAKIILGRIKGDNFIKIDSTIVNNGYAKLNFPGISAPGMYRVILGQTTYARVMKEAPQQFDFIYNKDDIALKTNFNSPTDRMEVIRSEENKVWFTVLKDHSVFEEQFNKLQDKVDEFWSKKDTSNALDAANNFNTLQMEWDLELAQNIQQNQGLLVSKFLRFKRLPILDGFLSAEERKEALKEEFFTNVDFNDPVLINSSAYTDKVFNYLVLFNQPSFTKEQRTMAYIKAVDLVMPKINQNEEVFSFLRAYLLHGFRLLQMDEVIAHIDKNY
jgi:hypothetical protein